MVGKTCVVTGATSGLGLATARELCRRGANVILLGRNRQKGEDALNSIQRSISKSSLEFHKIDLSSQEQIRQGGTQISKKHPTIDVLVNNVGTWLSELSWTEDQIETMFAVNHLSYFLLTHLLFPSLKKATDGRIINISSDSHFQGKIHFDDLHLTKKYHGLRAYGQSKLANVLFTYELDRRKNAENVSVNAVQPGLVKTDIGLKHTNWLHSLAWKLRRSGGVPPEQGAATQLHLAIAQEVKGLSGKYWNNCSPKPSSKSSYNEADASRLWEISEEMCGIDDYFEGGSKRR